MLLWLVAKYPHQQSRPQHHLVLHGKARDIRRKLREERTDDRRP